MASLSGEDTSKMKSSIGDEDDGYVFVFDRRSGDNPEVKVSTGGVFTFEEFRAQVTQSLGIGSEDKFVITTTNRDEIKDDDTWHHIECGDTLYVLQKVDQELCAQAQEKVTYLPHYDTIVKGGMYEYYASEGQNPLPYAFAELIDNALAATVDNPGPRKIEIRLYIDDQRPQMSEIFVIDNGKGMTSYELNNWAVYRLSKFNRREKGKNGDDSPGSSKLLQMAPRSLNSDISYFGVGGKQAIFFIGTSTRMISKAKCSKDVHELNISKEEFERREKNHESIYSGFIRNRKPGDLSHVAAEEETLRGVISEEVDKTSFTCVHITGINTTHVPYLKNGVKEWTRQLAHIYHYYIHGPNGNVEKEENGTADSCGDIDIQIQVHYVKMYHSGHGKHNTPPKLINLRDIDDDMQTQYIRTGTSAFEFKAIVEGTGIVEGILRYHPFLYDRETFPSDANDPRVDPDQEEEPEQSVSDTLPARGRRPTFECYWNGRLIPYTSVDEFDWCAVPKKSRIVPAECYNRISGVLWTNDKFQVSTNKLTFIDLEVKLRDKNTAYCKIMGRQKTEKRTSIEKEFTQWLKECHEQCDKQVKFCKYERTITRNDLPRNRQHPWAVYSQIEWDGKVFQKGQLVRIVRTLPIIYGSVKKFLLYGDHEGDVFATGGDLEIIQEPQSLYDEVKIVPLNKLDRAASDVLVKKYIDEEEAKLPSKVIVSWPDGEEVKDGDKRPAGKTVGDIKVEIANRKGELINKLPGSAHAQKKLLVELKVIWHSPSGDEVIVSHISQHGKNWPYWFRKMENVRNLGRHTLQLQVVLNETGATKYAGKTLPSHKLQFTVTEADPEKFIVGLLDGPFRIGSPFQIPLEFQDEFGHPTLPNKNVKPILEASGLELKYGGTEIKGNSLLIRDIVALGSVTSSSGKNFTLAVKVSNLEEDTQSLKIRLLPGPPTTLKVTPEEASVENGNPVKFDVEVYDQAGNITTQPKLNVVCKFNGSSGLPTYSLDCSNSGQGTLTGQPILLKKLQGDQTITAKIDVPNVKEIATIERTVHIKPSRRAANIKVTYKDDKGKQATIRSGMDIYGAAGDTVSGLEFAVVDEAGRDREIDDNFIEKVKVNWTPRLEHKQISKGHLPDIRVPNVVSESKYCNINLTDGSGIELSFIVRAVAGEPSQIKCKCSGKNEVRIGEKFSGDILVSVMDKHGNDIKKMEKGVLSDLSVTGEGLVTDEMVRALGQTSGFNIHGVKFTSGSLGARELCVKWRELTDYARLQLVAGPPMKLKIKDWDISQPITMYNDSKFRQPLICQLCDDWGNATPEAGVRVQLARDPGIRLLPAPQPVKTNTKGQANFGTLTVTAKRGVFEIQPKAFMGRTTISGPKVKISVQPDATKPVSLAVDYDKSAAYTVGENLPDFTVSVLAEDDNMMSVAKPSSLTMKIWKAEGLQTRPPARAISFSPDSKRKADKESGVFSFSNRRVPEVSGTHNIMFIYDDGQNEVYSNQIAINVQPGPPVKLVPLQAPGTPTVSNTKNQSSRSLIRSLKLELRDKYGNATGTDVEGKITVEILRGGDIGNREELPELVGGTRKLDIALSKGQASVQNLTIQESTPGKDGQEYLIRCTLHTTSIPKSKSIAPYDIPFLFYNDAKKQSQMAALTRERDSLKSAIKTYKSLFDTTQQLINELKMSLHEAQQEETKAKAELRKMAIPASQLSSVSSVDSLIGSKQNEKDHLMNKPRRMCSLQPGPKHADVLGKIAQLALVADTDIARVLSWHMSADMDCVVTLTTKKAKEIYQQSNGKQQVLPLDSIFKKNLPDWNKPLPHERIRPNSRPAGNPVYARNLLHFPHDSDSCKIVFGMLLGDTIILDTLDHANSYRQEIVKYTHCPTILTRQGDRIRSNGKFGGLMNKALPIEKLKGVVFGEPLSEKYHNVVSQIDSLQNYKTVLIKRQSAQEELQEQVNHQKTPEMQAKLRECQEAEEQLTDIEHRLGISSSQQAPGRGKSRPQMASPEEPAAKRTKGQAVNGATPPTPTRAGLRRAAGTPAATSEPAKRSRRH